MSESGGSPPGAASPSILGSLREALSVLTAVLHTRLELFVTELEEERERLKKTLILTLLAFFGLSLGFILLTVSLVLLFWERGWLIALCALTALYLGIGIAAGIMLRQKILARPGLFPATLGELAKDSESLRGSRRE